MAEARLKKGKEKAVKQLHPWVFSGAIDHVKGKPANGEIISVTDAMAIFLPKVFTITNRVLLYAYWSGAMMLK